MEEAYDFLGVNPRASEPVVKKAVDALRQNWHPDLAADESDRRLREARIKRINAAWDLIRTR
ncbi:MAG: DnaJ domain-containing protein [Hyphomicrobiaceae bacterium]